MFEIKIINSGYIMADGGAMFGAIPKRAWSHKYPPNDQNLCALAMRCALIISEDRKILVDTGMGDKHLDKVAYYQPHSLINFDNTLSDSGYSPAEITDVILTHLHFDHCGYATRINEQGRVVPSFPDARYWLSSKQWENVLNPNLLEKDSLFADNILPVSEAGLMQLVENDIQICEGLDLKLFDGHTAGQLVVYTETKDGIYTFPGDLIPTSAHVPPEWISAYDVCALTSLNEKQRFLTEAEEKGYTLIYCHDPVHAMSKVKKLNGGFRSQI
jgi:glyoxylase-like metal-dependent hydrolase (beta-lactamase superfamily II)